MQFKTYFMFILAKKYKGYKGKESLQVCYFQQASSTALLSVQVSLTCKYPY